LVPWCARDDLGQRALPDVHAGCVVTESQLRVVRIEGQKAEVGVRV
jgi:hypothetical protein